jgi:hypothetical protein
LTVHVGAFEVLDEAVSAAKLEILYTHVTVDEIAAVPDLERRQWLLNMLVFLGRPVYTPNFRSTPLTAISPLFWRAVWIVPRPGTGSTN